MGGLRMSEQDEIFFEKYKIIADLESEIKLARDKMQKLWDEKGYIDQEVLDASIEVDIWLNRYQQFLYSSNRTPQPYSYEY
jgi:hypothetical protein